MAGGSLLVLTYYHPTIFPTDLSLVSEVLPFAGLAEVFFDMGCLLRPCVSELTDKGVGRLAITLPRLEALTLGMWSYSNNTFPTTVRSLHFLSAH